jgi:hypothetical protein
MENSKDAVSAYQESTDITQLDARPLHSPAVRGVDLAGDEDGGGALAGDEDHREATAPTWFNFDVLKSRDVVRGRRRTVGPIGPAWPGSVLGAKGRFGGSGEEEGRNQRTSNATGFEFWID